MYSIVEKSPAITEQSSSCFWTMQLGDVVLLTLKGS